MPKEPKDKADRKAADDPKTAPETAAEAPSKAPPEAPEAEPAEAPSKAPDDTAAAEAPPEAPEGDEPEPTARATKGHTAELRSLVKLLRSDSPSVTEGLNLAYNALHGAIEAVGECDPDREATATHADYSSEDNIADVLESHLAKLGSERKLTASEWRCQFKCLMAIIGKLV